MTNQEKRELLKQAYAYGAAIALREHGVSFFEAEKTAEELAEGEMPPAEEEEIDPQQLEELAQTPEGRSILSRIMGGAGGALGGAVLGGVGGALGGRVIGNMVNRAQGRAPMGIGDALMKSMQVSYSRPGPVHPGGLPGKFKLDPTPPGASNVMRGTALGGTIGTGLGAIGGMGEGAMGENDEGERSVLSRILGGAGGALGGVALGGIGGAIAGPALARAIGVKGLPMPYGGRGVHYPTQQNIGALLGATGGGALGGAAGGGAFD